MGEYIERDAARPDEFCDGVSCQECSFLKDPIKGGCRVDDYIMSLPSANVRPVVHGRWERLNWGFDYDRCSVCGYEHRWPGPFYYCPKCGAYMREE